MRQFRALRDVQLGVKNLLLHKLRSMLTMLGVVFGVSSVIAMLAVGEGASEEALQQIRRLGSNNILIYSVKPIEDDESAAGGQRARMAMYGLRYADWQGIENLSPNIVSVVPAKLVRREARLGTQAMELRVVGTTPDWFRLVRRERVAGRTLIDTDMIGAANPVVLTEHGARKLLATQHTIGQEIRIGPNVFEVVGIIRSAEAGGQQQTPDRDVDAYIPITTARQRYGDFIIRRTAGGQERERVELHTIIVEVDDETNVPAIADTITRYMQTFHSRVDYQIDVPLALLRQAEETKRMWNLVLGSIAGISLLVGGIGIMNIMLASVTERTREIGIRRAIGAKRRQIVSQFLIETVVLSTMGGIVGVGLGFGFPAAITYFSGMPTLVTLWSLILAVGISVGVGILFGIYPAVRAARLDPIVALRHV